MVFVEAEGEKKAKAKGTYPPKWLVDAVYLRGYYGGNIKPLTGVIHAPTIRIDGSIIQTSGYDEKSGLYFSPQDKFPKVPQDPSRDDAREAVAILLEVIRDFPTETDSDKSAWIAMLLSMIGRQCIDGCCPLFAITANIRGAGKSLLVDAASVIAYGKPASRRPFGPNNVELSKVVTTAAIEGTPAVLFDNVAIQLRGSSLDAAITSRIWQDRILGYSQSTGELPLRTVWTATGNNMQFGSDIARRVLPIRLASPLENPEDRDDFAEHDLLEYVSANRPALAVAALTILRAYFCAQCPMQPGGVFGSFENWSRVVRGAIVWTGLADPLDTRETAKASDDSAEQIKALIYGLLEADPDCEGVTTKQIERLVGHKTDIVPTCPTLVEVVADICGDKFNSRRLGYILRTASNRTIDGMKIVAEPAGKGVKRWKVETNPPITTQQKPANNGVSMVQGGLGEFLHSQPLREKNNVQNKYSAGPELNPPKPPNPPIRRCPKCAQAMNPAKPIAGFRNWDCPGCGKIDLEKIPVIEVAK